ncbi:MAG TPA: hypothetical protein VN841_01110 [Bryobacteraceae bacterium]|nr:hypothetical protein [Bryobacteraceae bacterium]
MSGPDLAQEALKIGFGWVLGLASPLIWEWQKRRRRVKELKSSVIGELNELRYKMGWVALTVRMNRGNADAEFINWLDPIVQNYVGAETNPELVAGLKTLRELLLRNPGIGQQKRPLVGLGVKEYTLPLLDAHLGEISNFRVKFQSAVLAIKGHLDLFNQTVSYLRKLEDRTFDQSITGVNREAVMKNIDNGFVDLANRAKRIADLAGELDR